MIVISTAFRSPYERICRRSVENQTHQPRAHVYIDAALQPKPLSHSQNLFEASQGLDPDEVVVQLDGDDWLAHRGALERIATIYTDPDVWLTYGSYVLACGLRPILRPYLPTEDIRTTEWRCTHLKTWRAGLFAKLLPSDFQLPDGNWTDVSVDRACMYPMVEMAGWARTRFVGETLYTYNLEPGRIMSDPRLLARSVQATKYFGELPHKARLEHL